MKLSSALAGLALALAPSLSSASPLLDPGAVPADAARNLAAAVRVDRARNPEAYRRVADLEGLHPERYRRSRRGRPSVAVELRAMGPAALLPMLDALALAGYPSDLSADERGALRLGLLEAVSDLRDARSLPVLRGVFATATDPAELRAAARGLARVCQDADRRTLTAATGARRDAAVAALGYCAHPDVPRWLASQLDTERDPARVPALAAGFAEAASSWARPAGRAAVDPAVRAAAARAMVRRWVELPAARHPVGVSLLSMGGAEALAAVRDAQATAPTEARAGLRALERSLTRDQAR